MKYTIDWNQQHPHSATTVYRIVAAKDFSDVKRGDVGGYVESSANLSQFDDCWIYDEARVYDGSHISGDAKIKGMAEIKNRSQVYDTAVIVDATLSGCIAKGSFYLNSYLSYYHQVLDSNSTATPNTPSAWVAVSSAHSLGIPGNTTPSTTPSRGNGRWNYDGFGRVPARALVKSCTCGAQHTSFPKHHSNWCDIKGTDNK